MRVGPLCSADADYGAAQPWDSTKVSMMHLPGTSLYMAQAIAGSGACQALRCALLGTPGGGARAGNTARLPWAVHA
jgi:hypothetical protein